MHISTSALSQLARVWRDARRETIDQTQARRLSIRSIGSSRITLSVKGRQAETFTRTTASCRRPAAATQILFCANRGDFAHALYEMWTTHGVESASGVPASQIGRPTKHAFLLSQQRLDDVHRPRPSKQPRHKHMLLNWYYPPIVSETLWSGEAAVQYEILITQYASRTRTRRDLMR
jgi:hypothetical protein